MTGSSVVPYAGTQPTPVRWVTASAMPALTGVAPHMMNRSDDRSKDSRVGVRGDRQRDGRDRHFDCDAVAFRCDAASGRCRIAGCSRIQAPVAQRREDVEQAEDVRRRRGDLDTVAVRQPQCIAPLPDGGVQGGVGVPDGLGQTGGAGTEHQQGFVLGGAGPRRTRYRFGGGDRFVQVQRRHQAGQYRMVADGVGGVRQRQRVVDLVALPGGADAARPSRPAARSPAVRRRTPDGWKTSRRPADLR